MNKFLLIINIAIILLTILSIIVGVAIIILSPNHKKIGTLFIGIMVVILILLIAIESPIIYRWFGKFTGKNNKDIDYTQVINKQV